MLWRVDDVWWCRIIGLNDGPYDPHVLQVKLNLFTQVNDNNPYSFAYLLKVPHRGSVPHNFTNHRLVAIRQLSKIAMLASSSRIGTLGNNGKDVISVLLSFPVNQWSKAKSVGIGNSRELEKNFACISHNTWLYGKRSPTPVSVEWFQLNYIHHRTVIRALILK